MREPLVKHEIVRCGEDEPFFAENGYVRDIHDYYVENSHWHKELEIVYAPQGRYVEYIDSERIEVKAGQMIVVNPDSVHRVISEEKDFPDHTKPIGVLLIIKPSFIEANFPEFLNLWFCNTGEQAAPEEAEIMMKISAFLEDPKEHPYGDVYMKGLVLELLYHMAKHGIKRENVQIHSDVQQIKKILCFVEDHYQEHLVQADVAKAFYFSPQYFARYFKRCTGITFMEHLTTFRVNRAREELLNTQKRINEIAQNNGFPDDRSFINAFKGIYRMTPAQYRKTYLVPEQT